MAEDDVTVPDSLLPYDEWTQEALRQVVMSAVGHVAENGLPGGHHFYITFKTAYPGVVIPERLRAQYPDEMTIVLQHQFHSLKADLKTQMLTVGLSFSGVPSLLTIPVAAVTAFADPEVRFGLSFDVDVPEAIPLSEIPAPEGDDVPSRPTDTPADVVSLDAFRRKSIPKD
jgi:hypothetical protein